MSAIGGIVALDGRGIDPVILDTMIVAAPGFAGSNGSAWRDELAGLARVSLATTPEALAEQQPYRDTVSDAVIAFDGRIDNRDEIRALIGTDAPPRDAPDCVIALAGWRALGTRLLDDLAGDYALAVWEPRDRRLTVARGPIGWRPLLWTQHQGRVAFASEVPMLVRGLSLTPAVNEGLIGEHLSIRVASETETLWQGIHRLAPGHFLIVDSAGARVRRWLEGPFADHSRVSEADHVELFRALFDQALVATTRSAGPIAAHLSGGLDSSSIVCRSRELADRGTLPAMPETISARFPGEDGDEGPWMEAVEEKCGIRSHQVFGPDYDWPAMGEWCARTLHLPLRANTMSTIVASCDWLKRAGIRVLLTGEGGDDWLAGSFAHFPDLLRQGRWRTLLREGMSETSGGSAVQRLRWTLSSAIGPLISAQRRARLLRPHLDFGVAVPEWIAPDWARRIGLDDRWRQASQPPALAGLAQRQRYAVYSIARRHVNADNVIGYLAGQGVEVRHPFHDFRLTKFIMGAAGGSLRRDGVKKRLLRDAMHDSLPELVRDRRTKANLDAAAYRAVADRLRQRPIRDLACVRNGWVRAEVLETIDRSYTGWRTRDGPAPTLPYAPLWNAISIDLWLDHAAGVR